MKRVARRQVLASLGVIGGAGVLAGCHSRSRPSPRDRKLGPRSNQWPYVELAPELVARKAYGLFPYGGCMYALTGGIITGLGDVIGEPYRSFPFEMMQYGAGGTAGWGSLCGALNGAAAMIGLLHAKKPAGPVQRPVERFPWYKLIDEVFAWYESAELPTYQPEDAVEPAHIASSVAGSVLCHVSLSNWCETTGHKAFSPQMRERCRRLTADVAMKTVEVLNRGLDRPPPSSPLSPSIKSCMECHGKKQLADAMGKMNCSACHKLPAKHP